MGIHLLNLRHLLQLLLNGRSIMPNLLLLLTTTIMMNASTTTHSSSRSIFTSHPLTEEIETRPFGEDSFHLFLNNVTRENMLTRKYNRTEGCEEVSNFGTSSKDKAPIIINIWSYSPDGKLQLDQRKELSKRILPPAPGSSGNFAPSPSSLGNFPHAQFSSSENELGGDIGIGFGGSATSSPTALANRDRILPVTVSSIGENNIDIRVPSIPPTTAETKDVILFLLGTLVSMQKNLESKHKLSSTITGYGGSSIGSSERFSTAPNFSPRQILDLDLSTESAQEDQTPTTTTITPAVVPETQNISGILRLDNDELEPSEPIYLNIVRLTKAERLKAQFKQIARAEDYNYSFDDENLSRSMAQVQDNNLRIGNLTIQARQLDTRLMQNLLNLTMGSNSSSLMLRKHCIPVLPEESGDETQIPSPNNIPIPTSGGQSGPGEPGGLGSVFPKEDETGIFLQDWWGGGFGHPIKTSKKKKDKGHGHEEHGWGWGEEEHHKKKKHKDKHKKEKHKKDKHKKKKHKHKKKKHKHKGHEEHHEQHGWEHKEPEHHGWGHKEPEHHGWGHKEPEHHGWGHKEPEHHGWGHKEPEHHGWGHKEPEHHGWHHKEPEHKPQEHGWGWHPPQQHHQEHHGWEHKEECHDKKCHKKHKKQEKKKHKKKKKLHKKKEKHKKKQHKKKKKAHKKAQKKHKKHNKHKKQKGHGGHGWGHQEHGGWEHKEEGHQQGGWGKKPDKGWQKIPQIVKISGSLGGKGGWGSGHDGYYEMEFNPGEIFHKLLPGLGFMAVILSPFLFVAGICWLISSVRSPVYVHKRSGWGGGGGWHRRLGHESYDHYEEPPDYRYPPPPRRRKSGFWRG